MLEFITLISAITLLLVSLIGYFNKREIEYVFWSIAGLAYLIIVLALVIMGLDALRLTITPLLGSIYPSFLAVGIISIAYKWWRYYFIFVILMLMLIIVATFISPILKGAVHGVLHTISGLIIVFLPLIYIYRKIVNIGFITATLGGITIGIGGLALAALMAGKPILPLDLVIMLLHPLLFLSAFLFSIGIYIVQRT